MKYLLAFLVLASPAFAQTAAVRTNGLVGWWPLEGGQALDRYSTVNGTLSNGVTAVAAKLGGGLGFTATSTQSVYFGTTTDWNFANTTFTVAFWYRTTTTNVGIFASNVYVAGGWAILVNGDGVGTVSCNMKNGAGAEVPYNYISGAFNKGQWRHLAVVATTSTTTASNNGSVFYVDGVLQSSTRVSAGVVYAAPGSPAKFLGRRSNATSPLAYTGQMDDVLIYNRALSPQEIAHLATFNPYGAQ